MVCSTCENKSPVYSLRSMKTLVSLPLKRAHFIRTCSKAPARMAAAFVKRQVPSCRRQSRRFCKSFSATGLCRLVDRMLRSSLPTTTALVDKRTTEIPATPSAVYSRRLDNIPNYIQLSLLFSSAIGENIPAADSILMECLNTELLRPGTDIQQPLSARRREPPPDAA